MRKMRREKKLATGLVAAMVLALLAVPAGKNTKVNTVKAAATFSDAVKDMTIASGVTVDGFDVSGLTPDEALASLKTEFGNESEVSVTLNSSVGNVTTTLGALGYDNHLKDAVDEAVGLGNTGTLLKRYKDQKNLAAGKGEIALNRTLDEDMIKTVVNSDLNNITDAGNGFTLNKNDDGTVSVSMSGEIASVDSSAMKTVLEDLMADGWDGSDITTDMQMADESENATAQAIATIHDKLGTYTTHYDTGTSRAKNVERATELMNGRVLFPGETISVYQNISPITVENGYGMGHNYVGTKIVDGVGGGVCQVATTLYNAALLSELEIVQRNNHSMTVSYVPISFDAAIAGGILDLKFKNNLENPIYICGEWDGSGNLTFTIYGKEYRDPGRTIKFKSATTGVIQPGEDRIVEDGSVPVESEGVTVEKAVTGYTGALYKYVYENGTLVDTIQVNSSRYQASAAEIHINPGHTAYVEAQAAAEAQATADAQAAAAAAAAAAATPATEAPATEAPATEAPATEAPATEVPATEASDDQTQPQ
ncbi:MAG: VanW family protein [Lachnospiraceae bacterium]|nr:VanW family protein [Lachnospiraceae bacterium]